MPAATPKSKLAVLKVSSDFLKSLLPESPATDDKDKIKDASSPPSSTSGEPLPPSISVDNASDAASTPVNGEGNRRKSNPGSRGTKRSLNQNGDSSSSKQPRKPGPKKKLKLDEAPVDAAVAKLLPPAHKLGPKANQGAINAGLRALDRTGAPCRKWERKSLQLKSFTGIMWDLPSWRAPKPQKSLESNGESSNAVTVNGDSDSKAHQMSSAVPSEKSNMGEGDLTPLPVSTAQSPAPAIAMTA